MRSLQALAMLYKISKSYGENNEIGIMWNDPELNINWPSNEPIVSEKDKNNSYIKDINFQKYNDLERLKCQ